jgi:uncharacterized protein (DUF169 family)
MKSRKQDLSVFNKFNFERPPVGVKFLLAKPKGIERIDKKLAICEMIKEAQLRETPFYAGLEDHSCGVGTYILGQKLSPVLKSGYFGAELKAFKEARYNRRIYDVVKTMGENTVKYVVFSPLNKLTFDPDLLIVLTDSVDQTDIILRAMIYSTGKVITSRMTIVMGCAWLFSYPFITGELNYMTTGIGWGIKIKGVFPPNRQVISIPFDCLPTITENLQEMPWVPVPFTDKREEFEKKIAAKMRTLFKEDESTK